MASATALPSPLERARTYASFVRFEHTLFSLPLVLAGIFSVPGPAMSAARWALVALAAVGARTTALALNRIIDRGLDALNPRTAGRELPSGRIAAAEAWALLIASTLVCLEAPGAAVWLSVFALFWVSGFDIIYATLDEDFDRGHGVRSLVAALGRRRALAASAALHALAALALAAAAARVLAGAPRLSWGGLATLAAWLAATGLLWLEQRRAEDVDLAFFKVNVWVGFAVLLLILAARGATGF